MSLARNMRLIVLAAALLLLYFIGVAVRQQYGIRIIVRNLTRTPIRNVWVSVENRGKRYSLGDVPAGHQRSTFVQSVTESHVDLGFIESNGAYHTVTVVGYAEHGYCGDSVVTILPDSRVEKSERIRLVGCWRSWLDFM